MASILFIMYWILKSFYTQSSGGLQIGDYVFVLSFFVFFADKAFKGKGIDDITQQDILFFFFVVCVGVINGAYFILNGEGSFLYPIFYFVFNFCVIIEFRELAKSKKFLDGFFIATFLCIAIQFLIYLSGRGRWLDGVGVRYMGTFNDPNQLAFFVMSRFFILYIMFTYQNINTKMRLILTIVSFIITVFLVVQSASTGMLLGLAVFSVAWLVRYYIISKPTKKVIFSFCAILFVLIFFLVGGDKLLNIQLFGGEFISDRLEHKLGLADGGGLTALINDRCLGPFFAKPYYTLFGAGEGGFYRFIDVGSRGGEMHSTILGLLFYYGIIPYIILYKWIKVNVKGVKGAAWVVFIALFVEMLTLVNHRQASLWIIFILPNLLMIKERDNA